MLISYGVLTSKQLGKLNLAKAYFTHIIMKGISVKEFGDSEVCKMATNLPVPEPQEHQV
jgi:hypothetical protein